MRIKTLRIKNFEKGLYFRNGEFSGILDSGRYWFLNPFITKRVDVVSQRSPWLYHEDLDAIVKSGKLGDDAVVIDLKDKERALVWIEGRFATVLSPGQYAIWTKFKEVKVEVVDASKVRFEHDALAAILKTAGVDQVIEQVAIDESQVGLFYLDGEYVETLQPGRYVFWRNVGKVKIYQQDMREQILDVNGQDIMTADKVTLRLNAVVTYQVKDPLKAFTLVGDVCQALYRESQLALRAVVGTRDLDAVLADKDSVSGDMQANVRKRAAEFGVRVISLGIRDVILPGEMKELLNKVTEAKKAAEANLIARREEVAAMRSQANTAKMLADSPTLMRLRELEILEKIAGNSKMNVILGEKGLTDRVVNLL